MGQVKDMTGQRFGAWVVLRPSVTSKNGIVKWLCRCDCGDERSVFGTALRARRTLSCGCKKGELVSEAKKTHGRTDSPTYKSWRAMWARCTKPSTHGYAEYGGRGIKVCERWKSFEHFLADMGERPEGMTLDRFPNRDGNYEPGNCRWAPPKEQAFNRSSTVVVSYQGEEMSLAEFGRKIGMTRQKVRYWYEKRGLSPNEIAAKAEGATHHAL